MKTVLLVLLFSLTMFAQTSELERAIDLYRQGSYASSLTILDRLSKTAGKQNPTVWNYLGLNYLKIDDMREARKMFEIAVKLAPSDSTIQSNYGFVMLSERELNKAREAFSRAIDLNPNNSSAYFLRGTLNFWESNLEIALSDATRAVNLEKNLALAYILRAEVLLAKFGTQVPSGKPTSEQLRLIDQAVATLEDCNSVCSPDARSERDARISGLKVFKEYFERGNPIVGDDERLNGEVITPVRIISQPSPELTDIAIRNSVSGVVRALALFDSSGRVTQAVIVKALGYGLDGEVIVALRAVRFRPATLNGKPVSVVKMVEFSF